MDELETYVPESLREFFDKEFALAAQPIADTIDAIILHNLTMVRLGIRG